MKLKKFILILVVPFFITGCASVNYNLEIDKNLGVKEEVFLTATSEYFDIFYKEYPETVIKRFYEDEDLLKPLKDNGYEYSMIDKDIAYPGILTKKNYISLDSYTKTTVFKNISFENIESSVSGDLVTIQSKNFIPYVEDETDNGYPVSNLVINIKVPYVVTSNNADKFDKKSNTYTWKITKETENKEIKITFDKTKVYVYNLSVYISFGILCLLIIILIFVIRYFVKKNKKNNKI